MDKRVWIVIVWLCIGAFGAKAQSPELLHKIFSTPKDSVPYKLNNNLPSFGIKLLDSATIFETKTIPAGRYVALMFFSPDCSHCQETIGRLTEHMDSLKNIDFYLLSNARNISEIMKFSDKYHLADYSNIKVVGQDFDFFCLSFYAVRFVPDIALYDKHKKFVKLIESTITVKDLYDSTH